MRYALALLCTALVTAVMVVSGLSPEPSNSSIVYLLAVLFTAIVAGVRLGVFASVVSLSPIRFSLSNHCACSAWRTCRMSCDCSAFVSIPRIKMLPRMLRAMSATYISQACGVENGNTFHVLEGTLSCVSRATWA
jgi:hypothetical protein